MLDQSLILTYPAGAYESTSFVVGRIRVAQSLVFCVMFFRSLFTLCFPFLLTICWLSFLDLRLFITPSVSSHFRTLTYKRFFITFDLQNNYVNRWVIPITLKINTTRFLENNWWISLLRSLLYMSRNSLCCWCWTIQYTKLVSSFPFLLTICWLSFLDLRLFITPSVSSHFLGIFTFSWYIHIRFIWFHMTSIFVKGKQVLFHQCNQHMVCVTC
jgi:hypothetical protein